jgi:6-phosphofructokinase 1
VLLPELDNDIDAVCEKVISGVREGKLHDIIIKAEGVPVDSQELVKIVQERTGRDVKLVVLSYLQRGGSPTFRDRMLATMCGARAIDLIMQGAKNRAVGTRNGEIFDMDIAEALQASRTVDLDLYKGVDILSM